MRTDVIPLFSQAQCDALFAAVLTNDVIDATTDLPGPIDIDYRQDQLADSYWIARQVWKTGVDRAAFGSTIEALMRGRALGAVEQLAFKHARAKFKQLRFAYANFDASHRYPPLFHGITSVMGHLQDDFKNGRTAAVGARAAVVRLCLTGIGYRLIDREIDGFTPGDPEAFRRYVRQQVHFLRNSLSRREVTGREFHEIRKAISRQASFYVSIGTLYPSEQHRRVFRYLSAINGLMGRMHDDLVEKRINKAQDYGADKFVLPDDIRDRLETIASLYPKPTGRKPAIV